MSRINSGEVEISLNDETRVLKPTLRAMTTINRAFGGISKARDAVVAQDFDGCCTILRWGLNLSDKDAGKLPEQVFSNGLTTEMLIALLNYLAILANGGKPLPEQPEDHEPAKADEGNV